MKNLRTSLNPLRVFKALIGLVPQNDRAFFLVVLLSLWGIWCILACVLDNPDSKSGFSGNPVALTEENVVLNKDGKVRICSWNVCNYSISRRKIRGEWREYPKPENEKSALRKTLVAINADIVMLNEIGDASFLDELCSDLSSDGLKYPYRAITSRDSPSRIAIISRIRPEEFFDEHSVSFPFKGDRRYSPRGTIGASFITNGIKWSAFSIHLKSKQGGRKSDAEFIPFRRAEASAIGAKIMSISKKTDWILIGGDFNDEPSAGLTEKFDKNLKIIPFADGINAYTYYWKKRNLYFAYDYFIGGGEILKIVSRISIAPLSEASDHRAIYTDLNFSASLPDN